jgi:hypothetical protein
MRIPPRGTQPHRSGPTRSPAEQARPRRRHSDGRFRIAIEERQCPRRRASLSLRTKTDSHVVAGPCGSPRPTVSFRNAMSESTLNTPALASALVGTSGSLADGGCRSWSECGRLACRRRRVCGSPQDQRLNRYVSRARSRGRAVVGAACWGSGSGRASMQPAPPGPMAASHREQRLRRRGSRCCTTPEAVMLASLPLGAETGSLSETALWATLQMRGGVVQVGLAGS